MTKFASFKPISTCDRMYNTVHAKLLIIPIANKFKESVHQQ